MGTARKNTVVMDFSVLPVRPKPETIEKFLTRSIKLDMSSIKNLQIHNIRNAALIEMRCQQDAENLSASHNLQHTIEANNKKILIPIYMEDSAVNVRINDLPPDMPNSVVAEHMKMYGKVKSVVRETWKNYFQGVPNGVRVVRMEVDKPIPSYITISNEKTTVSYKNQIATCRNCDQRVHPNRKCSDVKTDDSTKETPAKDASDDQTIHHQQQQTIPTGDNERRTGRKRREHSPDLQHIEYNEMETDVVDGNTVDKNEWLEFHSKKMDRIIAKNKASIDHVNKLLKK